MVSSCSYSFPREGILGLQSKLLAIVAINLVYMCVCDLTDQDGLKKNIMCVSKEKLNICV